MLSMLKAQIEAQELSLEGGEQEVKRQQASTSQGQQGPEVRAWSCAQLHYLPTPTSGLGLSTSGASTWVEVKKKKPDNQTLS